MGIVPCFLIYPLLKKLLGTKLRIPAAALGGALSMFVGALCVVGEALLSGANGMVDKDVSKELDEKLEAADCTGVYSEPDTKRYYQHGAFLSAAFCSRRCSDRCRHTS